MNSYGSDDFEKWLNAKVKSNGDKLLPSTIERYLDLTEPFFTLLDRIKDPAVVLPIANKMVATNHVMYHAIKNMMEFLEYPEEIIIKLKHPPARAKAANSKRFLQLRIITRQELARLFQEVSDPKLNLALRILYDTACRRSELMSILWKDIQWKSKRNPKDEKDLARGIAAEIRIRGKGNKVRTVYLGTQTAEIIRLIHLKDPWNKDDPLIRFYMQSGEPLKDQTHKLYKMVAHETQRILARKLSPHCLRHTRATHMADAGADILDIAAVLGHESITTTKIYVEISSFRAREAFAKYSPDSH